MELVSDSISNLIQGVSQQPASLRSPSQLEAQENCYSSPVEGLIPRPPTEHIVKVSDVPLDTALIHTINRTATQRYEAIISRGAIQVFDLAGVAKTLTTVAETFAILSNAIGVVTGASYELMADMASGVLDFTVTGILTATVRLEFSIDGTTWTQASSSSQVVSNGTVIGIVIGTNLFMRVVIPAYTSGTITASVSYRNFRYLLATNPKTAFRAMTASDFTFIVNKELKREPDNTFSVQEEFSPQLKMQSPKANGFKGRVYVLANGGSGSTTSEFIAYSKSHGAITLIGEETGGAYEGGNGGSFLNFVLPHSKISIGTPLLYYDNEVTPPKQPGRGTMPDFSVPYNIEDVLKGFDTQLNFALKLIQKEGSNK